MGGINKSVLMITTDQQIDRRILQQADSLEKFGWKVDILATPLSSSDMIEDDTRVKRVTLSHYGNNGFANDIFVFYRKLNKLFCLPTWLKKQIRKFSFWCFINPETFYNKIFEEESTKFFPDIVVAHDLPTLPAAYLIAKKLGAKLIYDSHEFYTEQEFSKTEKKIWENIENKYIKVVDLIITVNDFIAMELQKKYELEQIPAVIYNALPAQAPHKNPKKFHEIFQIQQDKKVFLYQGGLLENRNLEVLVEAMLFVRDRSIVLVIMGDGPIKQKLVNLVDRLSLKDNVFFKEAVPQSQLLYFTSSADVGVIPYQATCINNYYCTPNKLFEFVAAGLPIIASDLPAINKILTDNQIGKVYSLKTPQEIAQAFDDFLSHSKDGVTLSNHKTLKNLELIWQEEKIIMLFKEVL